MTSQGHARAIFRRAVERRNLVVAEATAKELPPLSLSDAGEPLTGPNPCPHARKRGMEESASSNRISEVLAANSHFRPRRGTPRHTG
jgi:hypothetical protein